MLENIPLSNILFIDVETVPLVAEYSQLPEPLQPFWLKKEEKLAADSTHNPGDFYFDKAGMYSEFAKIVCISAGFFIIEDNDISFRCKAFYSDDESQLLADFAGLLQNKYHLPQRYLCGHNAREFDIPFIARRMLIHQIPLPGILNIQGKKPWEVCILDTMELWKFGEYKNYTSLALLAALFGIPTPKDDIYGADVARVYWRENDLRRIAVYCNKDVITTSRVYLKYTLKGDLPDDKVTSIVD
jgi:3'-5' exonuclease